MAAIHTALESLSPIPFSSVPNKNLKPFLEEAFKHAQLLVDSVPLPDSSSTPADNGRSRAASSASEMSESNARPSAPSSGDHEGLQKAWGKPLSVKKAENPLGITVYKMAGNDRKGAWFARRSVHRGLGFAKWKKALEAEFPETMKVQGAPGEGNIRGIGGERRVEFEDVKDFGRAEVYHLSAQFPGPTTPRDFVTLLVTSEQALNEQAAGAQAGKIPRHFMIISRPCEHPDCPPRDGFIRGQYQSVEFIREITSPEGSQDDENNPVEWIMITRSDPGGSVPRFMIERGTPGGICGDAKSFLDWACGIDEENVATEVPADADESGESKSHDGQDISGQSQTKPGGRKQLHDYETNGHMAGVSTGLQSPTSTTNNNPTQQPPASGLLSYVTGAAGIAGATLAAYTPDVIKTHLPGVSEETTAPVATTQPTRRASLSSISSSSSSDSFASASEGGLGSHHGVLSKGHEQNADSSSINTTQSSTYQKLDESKQKEAQRFEEKKAKLNKRLSIEKEKVQSKEAADTNDTLEKAQAKYDKDVRKQEEKYRKEVEKIERKREKEERKRAKELEKEVEKEDKLKLKRELEMARRELEVARGDRDMFKGQVEALQRENTDLVRRMGKIESGVGQRDIVVEPVQGRARDDTRIAGSAGHGTATEISLDKFMSK